MPRFSSTVYNIAFGLNCGLLFLLLLEEKLHLPLLLQVTGRMHPLMVHFPIVLVVLSIVSELLRLYSKKDAPGPWADALLLSAAFTAVAAALFGLFLSREEGYDPEQLFTHKWSGAALSFATFSWYALRKSLRRHKLFSFGAASLSCAALVLAGHKGANLTHGEDFLLAPLAAAREEPPVAFEDAVVFTHMVQPVLESKCAGCHNPKKSKGGLIMTSVQGLQKGGKNGSLWDSTEADLGLMLRRVGLPLSHKKHMPPQGKAQLEDEEIEIISRWVRSGASFNQKVADLPDDDTLKLIAASRFGNSETEGYDFAAAEENKIKSLSDNYRIVAPLAAGSPALSVSFFGAVQFNPKKLEELQPLSQQIVSLNLAKMPVSDADVKTILLFKNLRRLNLSFTRLTDAGVKTLAGLKSLQQLSLSGTGVTAAIAPMLAQLPQLRQVYLWQTKITEGQMAQLQQAAKNLNIVRGYTGDTTIMKLNPPLLENEEQIVTAPEPLRIKHFIKGTDIRFTTDGSEPDSLLSPQLTGAFIIDKNVRIKAKAFKTGWQSSHVTEKQFFRSAFRPDSIKLLQSPEPEYASVGAGVLSDLKKGDFYFRSGKWLGYREKPLEAMLYFNKPVLLSSVALSMLYNIDGYIMPPQYVAVWGGTDEKALKVLKKVIPVQPQKSAFQTLSALEIAFPATEIKILKVVAQPVSALPLWHPGKGQKGWVFVDEIILN